MLKAEGNLPLLRLFRIRNAFKPPGRDFMEFYGNQLGTLNKIFN